MPLRPRLVLIATAVLGLAVGLAIGAGSVLAQEPSATPTPSTGAGTAPVARAPSAGAPTVGATTTITSGAGGTGVAGTGVAGPAIAGSAFAYPVYAGTPGVAPDHTIVVNGVGQAEMKSDASNRAAAQRTALEAALADAKQQAETIASSTGLSITGVLSVSSSVSPYGYVLPMAAQSGTPNAPVPGAVVPSPSYLTVSVTVAYRVG